MKGGRGLQALAIDIVPRCKGYSGAAGRGRRVVRTGPFGYGEAMNGLSRLKREPLVCLALIGLTAGVYWQVHGHGFSVLDDDDYVVLTTVVHDGLTWEGTKWAFTTTKLANWHPLTWLSHMLDCQLFGPKAGPHHVVNVVFHVVNTLLLFLVLNRMTKRFWASAFVAGVFAVHPLHVESVAWISERKDVLSTFFWMLTMAAYLAYVKRPSVPRYMLVGGALALGLMAKPMLVTLPFVLLLLDYWPLGRFEPPPPPKAKKGKKKRKASPAPSRTRHLWRPAGEKLPLFALVALSSVATFLAQQHGGAIRSLRALPLSARVANAAVAYASYLSKAVFPVNLAVFYPHAGEELPLWQFLGAVALLLAVSAGVLWRIRKSPYLAVGWFWFLGTLVPVIGLVQVGSQAIADRYMYVPLIGLAIMAAWGLAEGVGPRRYASAALSAAGGLAVVVFAALTFFQVRYWADNVTLFEHAVAVTSDNDVAEFNLAIALKRAGRLHDAEAHFIEATRLRRNYINALIYLGLIEYERGEYDKAAGYYEQALAGVPSHPNYPDAMENLGIVRYAQGRLDEAITAYSKALELRPGKADTYFNLGVALQARRRTDDAARAFREALRLRPDHRSAQTKLDALPASAEAAAPSDLPVDMPGTAEECYRLGNDYADNEQFAEAAHLYREAVRLDSRHTSARINLGNAMAAQGQLRQAADQFRQVLLSESNNADAHLNLGNVLLELGKLEQAADEYRRVLEVRPNHAETCYSLGYTLAKQGKGQEALQAFSRAVVIDPSCEKAREAIVELKAQLK